MLSRWKQKTPEEKVYRRILKHSPGDAQVRHMLAALSGEHTPAKAESAYVTELFDGFAASFDQVLNSLNYRAPKLVGEKARHWYADTPGCVLDAGCGTGLCGEHLRPLASSLIGIDLSPGMLQRASALQFYDELIHIEIVQFLSAKHNEFDMIVSADTLCYFGDLTEFCQKAHQSMKSKGSLIFTVEAMPDSSRDYQLQHHGRYNHAKSYVQALLPSQGLEICEFESVELRLENTKPVPGWLVVAKPKQL